MNDGNYSAHDASRSHIAAKLGTGEMAETDPKTMQDITLVVETLLQQMQDKFQIIRIDDLEKNIADLMTQAGVEELEGENKIPTAQKNVVTEGTSHEELLLVCEQLGGTHAWSWQ
ncbi:hypothetical protein U0070_018826, partial [Myodes glareolus]